MPTWLASPRRRLAIVALLVALAVAVTVLLWPSPDRSTPAAAAPAPPTPTPTQTTPTPSPTPKPKPKPTLPKLAASVPTAFVMSGPQFVIRANVCGMDYIRPLDPPGDQLHTVCWVQQGWGVAPSSPSTGTTYVLGHAWAEAQLVLNPMSELAMNQVDMAHPSYEAGVAIYPVTNLNGYTITLASGGGRFTYHVTRAFAVNKNDAGSVPSVMNDHIPNRLVVITCGVHNGVDVDVNVIVYATLVGVVTAKA